MSNIEKIKAEIERMHQEAVLAACGNDTDWLRSRIGTCVDILAFIDSLPEETHKESLQVQETRKENQDSFTDEPKEMSVDEAMKYIDEKIAKTSESKSWEGVDVDKFMDEIRGREDRNDDNLPRYYGD